MNYKLNTGAGDNFNKVAERASTIAKERNLIVEFEFNGITCLVDKNTNLNWLYRDYCNSWTMGWKTVGANCVEKYDKETDKVLKQRNKARELESQKQQKEQKKKEDKEREAFAAKTSHVQMEFKAKMDWEAGKAKNTDGYGACIYEYAEGWAKLMQVEIMNGKKLQEIAESTSHELGFLGITGFMYGAAVSILSQCWLYGEQLRKWHNKEYNHEGDGVVNPAVITIST